MIGDNPDRSIVNPYNQVRFIDVYGPVAKFGGLILIGTLAKVTDEYTFDYVLNDHAMVSRPLSGVPKVHNRTVDIKDWSFFAKRLPSLRDAMVIKYVETYKLDASRPMSLLAVFGARSDADHRVLVSRL